MCGVGDWVVVVVVIYKDGNDGCDCVFVFFVGFCVFEKVWEFGKDGGWIVVCYGWFVRGNGYFVDCMGKMGDVVDD